MMKPEWVFAIDTGHEQFRTAIVADADGFCSARSTIGTGEWHPDSTLNPVDLTMLEYAYADTRSTRRTTCV